MNLAPLLALAALCFASNRSGKDAPISAPHAQGIKPVTVKVAPVTFLDVSAASIELPANAAAMTPPAMTAAALPELAATALPQAQTQAAAGSNAGALTMDAGKPAEAKGPMARIIKMLTNPFGNSPKEEPPPKSEAERLDREFHKLDLWGRVAPALREEIFELRKKHKSKPAVRQYVGLQAAEAMERMKKAAGSENLGFHYNLHGGQREEYVGKGIRATMGDIALNYTISGGDRNYKVYFFQSKETGLYELLDERNPQIMLFPSRMGSALNVFKLDAPELEAAKKDGRIKNFGGISMDFHGMDGVPYSAYAAPPLQVFDRVAKNVGIGKLSRDEETLATIRYLEAAVAAGGAYIPR